MGLQINTNVTALTALRNLGNVSTAVSKSIEKLSSGLRINSAADDPAGLIISESLRAQTDGLNQAISNSQDAANVIKTAEGALTEVNSLLRNIRQLSVHAANTGVNDIIAVQADQTQINSAVGSIDRIATQTQFGTKRLLDGSSGTVASVTDTTDVGGIFIGGTFGGVPTQAGTVTVQVTTVGQRGAITGAATYATSASTLNTVNSGTQGAGGTVVLNGQSIVVKGSDTVQTLLDKVNAVSATTGVSAAYNAATFKITLTTQDYGSNSTISLSESSTLINSTTSTSTAGTNAIATVSAQTLVNGATVVTTSAFTGGRGSTDSGLRLTDTYGNSILLTQAGNTVSTKAVATVTSGKLQFQVGGNAGQVVNASLGNIRTANLGTTSVGGGVNLSNVDVTTYAGANNAILVSDEAISQVSQLRANLGAFQKNTLESTVRYLGVAVENLSASESQIRDTNVAAEVVNLTKNQIIQQAATSVLAQANSAPQQILSLLR